MTMPQTTTHDRPTPLAAAWRRAIPILMIGVSIVAAAVTALADPPVPVKDLTLSQRINHLLNRIGYGPRPGDPERVERMGIAAYIDEQLHPERIDDAVVETKLGAFDAIGMPIDRLYAIYPQPGKIARELGMKKDAPPDSSAPADKSRREQLRAYYQENGLKQPADILRQLQGQKIVRAVESRRQLQEVMSEFWFNHFNIFWGKGADKWLTADFEMNAIRPNTLGTFHDLLMATAKSPAMLVYLDNFLSSAPGGSRAGNNGNGEMARPRKKVMPGINENYAREIMELHTLGVGGGYSQQDVGEIARCFTGWTLDRTGGGARFAFKPRMHDRGEKKVLGVVIPAGGGIEDGEKVIAILAAHPSTARFIASKLARRFVGDDPPPSLVDRVAGVYMKTGGDIREMLRTILTSAEFNAPDAYRAKIKSPFELAVSAIRALGGVTDGSAPLARTIARMGQPLYMYQPPTGYPDRAGQWVNTGALVERLNFALALGANRIPGTRVDLASASAGLDGASEDRMLDRALALLLGGDVSPATRSIVRKQMAGGVAMPANGAAAGGVPRSPVARAFGLVLGSPEFQRR